MKHVIPTLVGALTLYTMSPSGLAAPAHDDAVRQEIVRFGDLDLTRPADAQELYRRIKHAAHHVCEAIGFGDPETTSSPPLSSSSTIRSPPFRSSRAAQRSASMDRTLRTVS